MLIFMMLIFINTQWVISKRNKTMLSLDLELSIPNIGIPLTSDVSTESESSSIPGWRYLALGSSNSPDNARDNASANIGLVTVTSFVRLILESFSGSTHIRPRPHKPATVTFDLVHDETYYTVKQTSNFTFITNTSSRLNSMFKSPRKSILNCKKDNCNHDSLIYSVYILGIKYPFLWTKWKLLGIAVWLMQHLCIILRASPDFLTSF
eukprot:UN08436